MLHKVFCVFDGKALAYLPPFILPEVGMASRVFGDCVNSDDHQFGKHPEDYTLFLIGSYDDRTGMFGELDTRSVVANGVEMVRSDDFVPQPDLPFPVPAGNSEGADVPPVG